MKKVLLILSLVVSMVMSAQTTILSDFYGCKLGKSLRTEVQQKMIRQGARIEDDNRVGITYNGTFDIEDVKFSKCIVSFDADTMVSVVFANPEGDVNNNQRALVEEKYSGLTMRVEDLPMTKMFIDTIAHIFNLDSTNFWTRMDNDNAAIIIKTDSTWGIMYVSAAYMIKVYVYSVLYTTFGHDYDEANKVTSVAGCAFGATKSEVMEKFKSRAEAILKSDAHSISYSGVTIGGNYFKRAHLYFMNDKFISCCFETEFYTWKKEEAIATYHNLCAQYGRKYTNGTNIDDDSEKMRSYYGMLQPDYEDGLGSPIIISMEKGVSRGGDTYYYVSLRYFMGRIKYLYDDEI